MPYVQVAPGTSSLRVFGLVAVSIFFLKMFFHFQKDPGAGRQKLKEATSL